MSLPLAHAFVGMSVAVTVWPERTPAGRRRALIAGSLLAVCPDVDFVLGSLEIMRWGWHHGFTHSIAFALIVGAAASWALGLRGWRGVAACVLPVLSHPLLDYVITETQGVELWWPLIDHRYKLGIDALSYYSLAEIWGGWLRWVMLFALEITLFGPVFVIAMRASRRRFTARVSTAPQHFPPGVTIRRPTRAPIRTP
jgi:membrane-bound metal-dependent hydrolase YbcI (DUF457 family)